MDGALVRRIDTLCLVQLERDAERNARGAAAKRRALPGRARRHSGKGLTAAGGAPSVRRRTGTSTGATGRFSHCTLSRGGRGRLPALLRLRKT